MRDYNYGFTADQAYTWPWLKVMNGTDEGVIGGAGALFAGRYRLMMHAFRGDATVSSTTLDQTPIAGSVAIWRRATSGTITELALDTDFSVSGAVITWETAGSTAAPAAGVHHVIRYLW